jgi:hypothetical protein
VRRFLPWPAGRGGVAVRDGACIGGAFAQLERRD